MESRNELLKLQAERKDRMLDLIQHCTKISQGLEKMPANAGDRAIWELVQNACDISDKCHIKITLKENEFVFSHKGQPFTYETLSSLIRQVSSSNKQIRQIENGDKPTVGQYGTGFLTTHKFGRVIELKGSLDASLEGEAPCYVDLSDDTGKGFIIDREFEDILKFVKKMGGQIEEAQKLLQKDSTSFAKEWTEFHYKLNGEAYEIAQKALDQANKLMPYVIALNPEIEEVIICNGETKRFKCESIEDLIVSGYLVSVVEVGISDDENIKVYCLCSSDKKQITIIPPSKFPPLDETPSLFLYYPLLGSEDFGLNYIFHSANFEATELRDGIILPSENENTRKKYEQNVKELTEMAERLTGFLKATGDIRFSIAQNPLHARVNFKINDKEEAPIDIFFKQLKKMFVSTFEQMPLFEVDGEKVSIESGKVKVIHPSLLEPLTDEKLCEYKGVLLEYASKAFAIPERNPIEWSSVVNEWAAGNDGYFINCKSICETIKENRSDLLEFINLLNETNHDEMLNEFAIIPNRDGELCKAENLKYGKTIGDELFRIAKPLLGDKAKELVDDSFKDVYPFAEYSRTLLRDDISTYLGQVKKEKIDEGIEFADSFTRLLLEYCSYNPTESDNSFKSRLMPYLGELYNYDYKKKVMPSVEPKEVDLYETPFNYLVESSMIHIAAQNSEWVAEHQDLLYGFLSEYGKMTELKWKEKLTKYPVVPNENNKLCLLSALKKNQNVDDTLIAYYKKVKGEDLKDNLVHSRFADLFAFEVETALNVATAIQNELEAGNFQNRIVIDIIERLERKEWEGLFSSIFKQRESIRYNLGSTEEKKQINRLMRKNDENLLKELADVAEDERAKDIIQLGWDGLKKSKEEEYIKKLGNYVEQNLLRYLKQRLDEDGIEIRDEQCGQDYIVSKTGYEDYRVEVKSRWSVDESVEMSSLQVETAVVNPERFALVMVSMSNFEEGRIDRNDDMTDEEIEERIKVADNIGLLAGGVYGEVDKLFNQDRNVKPEGVYSFRVKQAVFKERNLGIVEFVEILKTLFPNN